MGTLGIRTRRWSRVEYERLIEKGIFLPHDRIELLAGELVVREPQGTPHAVAASCTRPCAAPLAGAG